MNINIHTTTSSTGYTADKAKPTLNYCEINPQTIKAIGSQNFWQMLVKLKDADNTSAVYWKTAQLLAGDSVTGHYPPLDQLCSESLATPEWTPQEIADEWNGRVKPRQQGYTLLAGLDHLAGPVVPHQDIAEATGGCAACPLRHLCNSHEVLKCVSKLLASHTGTKTIANPHTREKEAA